MAATISDMSLNVVSPDENLRYRSSMIPGAWQTRPRTATPASVGDAATAVQVVGSSTAAGYMLPMPRAARSSWVEGTLFGAVLLLVTWLMMWAASLLRASAV